MAQIRKTDIITEGEKSFFHRKFLKFIRELDVIRKDPSSPDKDQFDRESDHVKQFQGTINNFFLKTKGTAALIVCGKHHLLISENKEGGTATLQWEDHGGLLTNPQNPKVSAPINTDSITLWAKSTLKLSSKGEIKLGKINAEPEIN